jgi:hypothetical protein
MTAPMNDSSTSPTDNSSHKTGKLQKPHATYLATFLPKPDESPSCIFQKRYPSSKMEDFASNWNVAVVSHK